MSTSVTVRNVPEDVRNELTAKAARRGQSLQAYLLDTLTEVSNQPDQEELIERIKQRKQAFGTDLKAQAILAARDSDRRTALSRPCACLDQLQYLQDDGHKRPHQDTGSQAAREPVDVPAARQALPDEAPQQPADQPADVTPERDVRDGHGEQHYQHHPLQQASGELPVTGQAAAQ